MVHAILKTPGRRPSAGFSLAELLIVIVVVAVAGIAFASMFTEAVRTYRFVDSDKGMLQAGRYAEERIARELKRVKDSTSVLAATPTTFTFIDRTGATLGFSWSGVSGADLLFTKDGASHTLAAGVDSLAFAYYRNDGTPAVPLVAPAATDIWRVTVYLRLVKGTQKVETFGAAFVRSL
jgi:prepilin-type N-terminal cleavage/methylation domain-containing protein